MSSPSPAETLPAPTIKVVLLGDLGVGKTCLRTQFVHHVFTNAYKATIGGDYLTTTVRLPRRITLDQDQEPIDMPVNLQVWDTAGQERFNSISQAFYRGADVCVLVYDITNYESMLNIRDWFERFLHHCHVDRPGVVIVGNKADRTLERSVVLAEVRNLLADSDSQITDHVIDWKSDVLEVNSRDLGLVTEVFLRVAQIAIDNIDGAPAPRMQGFDSIDLSENVIQPGCAC